MCYIRKYSTYEFASVFQGFALTWSQQANRKRIVHDKQGAKVSLVVVWYEVACIDSSWTDVQIRVESGCLACAAAVDALHNICEGCMYKTCMFRPQVR